uniref:Uncharacterized protein n=1 Tax=Rhizophora mucronata TaxID=61149 RepID=A0A2P2NAR3_RHIMU
MEEFYLCYGVYICYAPHVPLIEWSAFVLDCFHPLNSACKWNQNFLNYVSWHWFYLFLIFIPYAVGNFLFPKKSFWFQSCLRVRGKKNK